MAFGTVFRLRPRPGQEAAVEEHMRNWRQLRGGEVDGVVAAYLVKLRDRPGELVSVAIFESEAQYRQNAADPRQDRWYRTLRSMLEDDPEWNDGDIVPLGAVGASPR